MEINHKDNDISNNRIDNLEFVTRQENMKLSDSYLVKSKGWKNRK